MLIVQRALLVLVLLGLSGWCLARTARATVSQVGLDWSARLLDLPSEWQAMPPREVLFNGARFGIASGRSDLPLPALLDRLQASCRERSELLVTPLPRHHPGSALLDGVLRIADAEAGMIACLELGSEPLGPWELLRRLQTFLRTGDLASVGAVRVVRVEAREQGSFFVAVASDGPLPLPLLFPSEGDAPGVDPADVPRPEASRRLLSVWQLGHEPSITVYETSSPLEESFPRYLASLRALGFDSLADPQQDAHTRAALFERAGHQVLLVGARSDAGREESGSSLVLSTLDAAGSTAALNSAVAPQPR